MIGAQEAERRRARGRRRGAGGGALGHVAAHFDGLAAVVHRAPAPAAVLGLVGVEPGNAGHQRRFTRPSGPEVSSSQAAYATRRARASSVSSSRSGAPARPAARAEHRPLPRRPHGEGWPAPAQAPLWSAITRTRPPPRRSRCSRRSSAAARSGVCSLCQASSARCSWFTKPTWSAQARAWQVLQMVELRRQTGLVDSVRQVERQVAADDQQWSGPEQKCFHQIHFTET